MKLELLLWAILFFSIALPLQDRIRQRTFDVSHRLASRPGCTLSLFSLLMLPGTLVHEGSHVVTALFMGSSVSKVSFRPRYDRDGVELGSMTAKDVGLVRNSVISVAPIVVGTVLILLVGWHVFDFPGTTEAIEASQWGQVERSLTQPFGTLWGWIGAYFIFIVSLNMLPSPQDFKSGAGFFLLMVALFAIFWIVLLSNGDSGSGAVQATNSVLSWLTLVFALLVLLSLPVFILLELIAIV